MESKNSMTRPELARKRRSITDELPFTVPVENGRQIEVCVPENKREKFETVAAQLDLVIVDEENAGKSEQGWRDRLTLDRPEPEAAQ